VPKIGVLFDVDDTLVDFAGAARSALLDVATHFDGPAPETGQRMLDAWAQVTEREYQRFLAGVVDFDQMLLDRMAAVVAVLDPAGEQRLDPAELERIRNESIFGHWRPYDDVPAALARLRATGLPVGVVSNSDGAYQRRKLAAAGLADLIPGAVFSGDLGVAKPDPEIFLAGADSLGLAPEHVVYVGDRWHTDIIGALSAGLAAVWVNRPGLPRPVDAAEQLAAAAPGGPRLAELPGLERLDNALVEDLLAGRMQPIEHGIGQRALGL
jgi:putative hydrolase of the HAD superfamily